ncbi:MAG: TolC family protein [Sediminibacterium sp.]
MPLKQFIYTLLFIGCFGNAFAQDKSLSIENTLDIVRKYHPVIKQSFLQNEMAKNELQASRAVFDPSIQINTQEKTYDNKLYYKYNTSELKIPLWYGIDIKAGTENNIGERIDPTLTRNKSAFVGVSMDPFRGIIVDKRNAVVKQAKNFVELTKNEQLLVVNDLLLEATSAYWNWVNAYNINSVLIKSVQNNKDRYEVIKKSYISGDRAPIDTTEALTQLQTFEMMQNQAALDLQKAKFELSNYFWTESGMPYELEDVIKPSNNFDLASINPIELGRLEEMVNQAIQMHPKLKMINAKSTILDIEKRLKTIELFPSLKLNYNALDNNFNNISTSINTTNNVKYGLSLTMPLFQRQARGQLAKTKNKIEDLGWDRKYLTLEIENKVRSSFAEFYALKQQIKTNEAILNANKLLFETENTKFQMGESSLFLINSRELKFIETEQKNIALKTKFYLSIYKNLWAMGSLN